ncbi:hypothetical protein F2P81_020870 [Scophthalmus maximus]|uniref:Uncharacterized protein n=1 Tax=Scophthalmus maximus TaxID=52904 RepID=A0A6A4RVS2_SCOMX|nr:hypothetical protein F2P81_020870 [Scophthalmus maximus]
MPTQARPDRRKRSSCSFSSLEALDQFMLAKEKLIIYQWRSNTSLKKDNRFRVNQSQIGIHGPHRGAPHGETSMDLFEFDLVCWKASTLTMISSTSYEITSIKYQIIFELCLSVVAGERECSAASAGVGRGRSASSAASCFWSARRRRSGQAKPSSSDPDETLYKITIQYSNTVGLTVLLETDQCRHMPRHGLHNLQLMIHAAF